MLPVHKALDLEIEEKVLLELAREALRESALPVHYILDVGAATGRWSFYVNEIFYDLNKRFHLFEPHPEQFIVLVDRHWDDINVELNFVAVSNQTGPTTIHLADFPEHSSFYGESERPRHVFSVTVDDYCKAYGVSRISLLKVDVEGAEPLVLRGAQRMLMDGKIDCLQLEYGGGWRESLVGVCQHLTSLGYTIWAAPEGRPEQFVPVDDLAYRNILALRSPA